MKKYTKNRIEVKIVIKRVIRKERKHDQITIMLG